MSKELRASAILLRILFQCTMLLVSSRSVAFAGTPVPRAEVPRPDMMRDNWMTLNGQWNFEFDDHNQGLAEQWFVPGRHFNRVITVPFTFETKLSGIADTSMHDVVWYQRTIDVPKAWASNHTMLNFGAVNYDATVWVNGQYAGHHEGGQTGFKLDVTWQLKPSNNVIVVRVWYPSTDTYIPRGKQYWKPKSEGIFYTRTTGIWQPVWLEEVSAVHLDSLHFTPEVDHAQVILDSRLNEFAGNLKLRVTVSFEGHPQTQEEVTLQSIRASLAIKLGAQQLWSPEHPNLYDVQVELLQDGKPIDTVHTYFGQRKISVWNGSVYLNDAPYFLKLVLDQGYWPDSVLTPPSDEAMKYDIQMTKSFGLNGVRKHQKVEDPRWLYWADKLGLIVWGEMANAHAFDSLYVHRFTEEWQDVIEQDYNHPSIIVWVPINESWGVDNILTDEEQQEHVKTLYHLTKSLDQTRLVVDNDGWQHTDTTDLFTLHDYTPIGAEMAKRYAPLIQDASAIPRNHRDVLTYGYHYNGSPLLITEFGGIGYQPQSEGSQGGWGYSGIEKTQASFLARLSGLISAIDDNPRLAGYCYTQLTDVEQEQNGLMTYDRKPKVPAVDYAKIFAH